MTPEEVRAGLTPTFATFPELEAYMLAKGMIYNRFVGKFVEIARRD